MVRIRSCNSNRATEADIKQLAFEKANTLWQGSNTSLGLSYDFELIESMPANTALYKSRLKASAREMVDKLPYLVESMGKQFIAYTRKSIDQANRFMESNPDFSLIHADYENDTYFMAENVPVKETALQNVVVAGTLIINSGPTRWM